jgi:hypothetical protein
MINQNSDSINTVGYDSRSYIRARVINITTVYLE